MKRMLLFGSIVTIGVLAFTSNVQAQPDDPLLPSDHTMVAEDTTPIVVIPTEGLVPAEREPTGGYAPAVREPSMPADNPIPDGCRSTGVGVELICGETTTTTTVVTDIGTPPVPTTDKVGMPIASAPSTTIVVHQPLVIDVPVIEPTFNAMGIFRGRLVINGQGYLA